MSIRRLIPSILGVNLILWSLPDFVIQPIFHFPQVDAFMVTFRIVFTSMLALSYISFMWGFKILGETFDNINLQRASYAAIIFASLNFLVIVLRLDMLGGQAVLVRVVMSVLFGFILIFLGAAFMDFGMLFRPYTFLAGILNIAAGLSYISQIYINTGMTLTVPIYIVEIIVLLKAAQEET